MGDMVSIGNEGEQKALDILISQGYKIISVNADNKHAPADIVCSKNNKIYAINVKYGYMGFMFYHKNINLLTAFSREHNAIPSFFLLSQDGKYIFLEISTELHNWEPEKENEWFMIEDDAYSVLVKIQEEMKLPNKRKINFSEAIIELDRRAKGEKQ